MNRNFATAYITTMFFLFQSTRMFHVVSATANGMKKIKLKTSQRLGKTAQQKVYQDFLQQSNISMVVAVGCAGTGKTWLACHEAARALARGDVDRIVLTRPIVPVDGEDALGFLPGSLASKMDPWTRPMVDILAPLLPPPLQKQVEMIPLAYMRGRTFDRTFVIADEMQNSTPEQMLMLVTRIGNHSRVVVTGDPQQTDRPSTKGSSSSSSSSSNGLADLVSRLQQKSPGQQDGSSGSSSLIRLVHFTSDDVQRSALVTELLERIYAQPKLVLSSPSPPPPPPPSTAAAAAVKQGPFPPPPPTSSSNPTSTSCQRPPPEPSQDCALIVDDPYMRRPFKLY